jgi:hypothetical protein
MTLPSLPLFAVLSLLPGMLLLVLSRWCIAYGNRYLHSAIVSGAAGFILIFVSLASMGFYSFNFAYDSKQYPILAYLPLAIYCIAIATLAKVLALRGEINWTKLVLSSAAVVIPLYLLSGYSALLAACSFGDCL